MRGSVILLSLVLLCCWQDGCLAFRSRRWRAARAVDGSRARKLADGCIQEHWHEQRLDHFSRSKTTEHVRWKQRVVVCNRWWSTAAAGSRGPIFFYAGNEGDVYMYVNNTGLMWENAQAYGALLVFAEHRYYGESEPFGKDSWSIDPMYLTTGQAMADYASLIWTLKQNTPGAQDSPVIVFGGSYGGELAVWMRVRYPHLVTGSVAASAPILGFPGFPGFNATDFWKVVTYDASADAGSAAACANNTRAAFKVLVSVAESPAARSAASRLLHLCSPLETADDVYAAAFWLQGAFDAFAMGNYPYPSAYISGIPDQPLPAWPMRAACQHMTPTIHMYASDLLEALGRAAGVLYNSTGTIKCYELDASGPAAGNAGPWDFQVCTEQMAQEQPYFPTNGVTDMFWDQGPYNDSAIAEHCRETWGVEPVFGYPAIQYGGLNALSQTSNIVLSNGLFDPWSVFGVLSNVSDTVVAVIIPEGAHHLDLMFSHPDDPPSVETARQVELRHITNWIQQHKQKVQLTAQQRMQNQGSSSSTSSSLSSSLTLTSSSSSLTSSSKGRSKVHRKTRPMKVGQDLNTIHRVEDNEGTVATE